jgi:hypothetical protein
MINSLSSSVIWRPVGAGRKSHAFNPGNLEFAYCNLGPGRSEGLAPASRCTSCLARIARIEKQDQERRVNWG